jgi:hypothetical protein
VRELDLELNRTKELTMTSLTFASETDHSPMRTGAYRPGACNIGPAEIARRRMAGHIGLVVALAVLVGLIAVDLPAFTRLLVVLPAATSASGYLQAWLKFCAGFGSRGIFNFGDLGEITPVADADARERDRRRSRQIGMWALEIGIGAGIVAVILPV